MPEALKQYAIIVDRDLAEKDVSINCKRYSFQKGREAIVDENVLAVLREGGYVLSERLLPGRQQAPEKTDK